MTEHFRKAWRGVPTWGPWLLILWPVVILYFLVKEYAIDAPFLDDLMAVDLLEKAKNTGLTWHDFFAPQMEHRIAFTRSVMLLFFKFRPQSYFTGQIWFTFVLLCLTLVMVGILLRRTIPEGSRGKTWPLLWLAVLAICCPIHYQSILWPVNHQIVGLAFFLIAVVAVWQAPWPPPLRFVLAVFLALCATLSHAAGLVIWIVTVPVLWWSAPLGSVKTRVGISLLWMAVFAVTVGLYFHGIKNEVPPEFSLGQGHGETMSRDVDSFVGSPLKSVTFALRILGGPLAHGTNGVLLDVALDMGIAEAVALALAALYALWRFRDQDLRRRLMPWLAVAVYSTGAALAIAMGRVWLTRAGVNALSGRYLIHAVPLLVALPVLAWMILDDLRQRHPTWQRSVERLLLAGALTLTLAEYSVWSYGENMMAYWYSSCVRRTVDTLFFKTSSEVANDQINVPPMAKRVDDLHLMRPPMLANARLDNFKISSSLLNGDYAEWTGLRVEKDAEGLWGVAEGHAINKRRWEVADGIFLTYKDPADGHWEIFCVAQVTALPFYLFEAYSKDLEYTFAPRQFTRESLSAFSARFKLSNLPQHKLTAAAWAYDFPSNRVTMMPGYFEFDPVAGTVTPLKEKP